MVIRNLVCVKIVHICTPALYLFEFSLILVLIQEKGNAAMKALGGLADPSAAGPKQEIGALYENVTIRIVRIRYCPCWE